MIIETELVVVEEPMDPRVKNVQDAARELRLVLRDTRAIINQHQIIGGGTISILPQHKRRGPNPSQKT